MTAETASADAQAALEYVRRAERRAGELPGLPADEAEWRPGRAAVVGAGTMGGGIAAALANAGTPVVLIDSSRSDVQRGLDRVAANYTSSVRRGRLEQSEADRRLALIDAADDLAAVADADVVIEAVYEDMALKQDIFRSLDRHARPGALLGTNTSALDIDVIAAATARPDDVIGAHFFSPAHVMKLLEVIPGSKTSPRTVARLMALGRHLGKVAVRAGNAFGFIGNAMLMDYRRQAHFLVEEGAFPADVDRVLEEFGFAMGLFKVADMSGHGIGAEAKRKAIATRPKDRRYSDLEFLTIDLGRLGQKTGAGWYRYDEGDRTPHRDPEMERQIVEYSARIGIERRQIDDQEILDRCLYALVNRGAWLLSAGIAAKPGDIDVVYTNGYGFPAKRGGPMYWADAVGLPTVLSGIEHLHRTHGGDWWEPAPQLTELVREGSSFADLDSRGTST